MDKFGGGWSWKLYYERGEGVERYDKKGCLIAWSLDVSRWGR